MIQRNPLYLQTEYNDNVYKIAPHNKKNYVY